MGYNTVAVLLNDYDFDQPEMGKRIKDAMRGWSYRDRDRHATMFGAGQVISQAHADYTQIVVVRRNSGKPIQEVDDLDWISLEVLKACMVRHGYRVIKKRAGK